MNISPTAGKVADPSTLINIPKLVLAYYEDRPDPDNQAQAVAFGTSGHRGTSLECTFNQWHILATTQAICLYRQQQQIEGPLFLGIDTHALSEPAFATALQVLAANGVEVMLSEGTPYTPTPAVSHAILTYNRGRTSGLADGIVITPSHNPPQDGGFKYNPPSGGPADGSITGWIQAKANEFLRRNLEGVKQMGFAQALRASTTHRHDYRKAYVDDLENVIDMDVLRGGSVKLGVDPLGGAGVHYWDAIQQRYGLDLTVVNHSVDPTFRFMTLDWDGKIRMDPSSSYAMQPLIGLKDQFDVAFACDTDHDRHGVVTRSTGLLPSNHYLAVCVDYLFAHRPGWSPQAGVGKTMVSSSMIDRVAKRSRRRLHEVPVGFKFFVDGLLDGSLGFAGEESAGSSFLRRDGTAWSTDKDGLIAGLLAGEITARKGRDPGELYQHLTRDLGEPVYERLEAPATLEQKAILAALSPQDITAKSLAGEIIEKVLTEAPAGGALQGLKVATANGWFAARPSGTEQIYKIYAESFLGREHLLQLETEAQALVSEAFAAKSALR